MSLIHGHRKEVMGFEVFIKVKLMTDFRIQGVTTTFPGEISASQFCPPAGLCVVPETRV